MTSPRHPSPRLAQRHSLFGCAGRPGALRWLVAIGFALSTLSGCAGFRGGWQSVPYVGEVPPQLPPAETPAEAQDRSQVALPGLRLGVDLNNRLRTYDTQVMLFIVPVSIDPRERYMQDLRPGITRVTLRIEPLMPGFVLQATRARLTVGGRSVAALGASEFAQWGHDGAKVGQGGRYGDRPLPERFELDGVGLAQIVHLEFPIARPSPESPDIQLDLGEALFNPATPALPLIRFVPVRWKHGYT